MASPSDMMAAVAAGDSERVTALLAEDPALVDRRVKTFKQQVIDAWSPESYPLAIETEIFWRKGAPPKQKNVRIQGGR